MRQAAYIHIPFCRHRCFYCDFPISVVGDRTGSSTAKSMTDYVQWLCQEIIATPTDRAPLDTVFFGGGTPSLLPAQLVGEILECLDQQIGIDSSAEISMEMDPGTFSYGQLQTLLKLGLNRVSLGVQAFQDHLLQRCGRSHRRSDILASIDMLNQLGVENFSIDLISGLPGQTAQDWEHSLAQAIAVNPMHLSCYDMVLEPITVFGRQEERGQLELPADALSAQMYRRASERLRNAGYLHYEISSYAKPGYQCRHNLTYWNNHDFYGFGVGAASFHCDRRISRPRTRTKYYQWVKRLQADPSAVISETPVLDPDDRRFEDVMVGLRLATGINLNQLNLSRTRLETLTQAMAPYLANGWLNRIDSSGNTVLKLTDPEGFLYSNQVLVKIWDALDQI